MSFRDMIQKALTKTPKNDKAEDHRRAMSERPNRQWRRQVLLQGTNKGSHARQRNAGLRARAGTGVPAHVARWRAEDDAKRVLGQIDTHAYLKEIKGVTTMPASRISSQYKTVHDLANGEREHLLAIKGVGDGVLDKIQDDLGSRGVVPRWAKEL